MADGGKKKETQAPAAGGSRASRVPKETLDRFYVEFERKFRGDPATLRQRMAVYTPYLRKLSDQVRDKGLLDLGCGPGDWLALAGEAGWRARGVDSNQAMIEACKRRGLDVVAGDALEVLGGCADDSLGVVSAFHLVEHLPFEVLLSWALDSFRVLAPGGMLIAETPNPENYRVGAYNFYLDLTHRNPVPAPTLQFVLEFAGFEAVEILRLHPVSRSRMPAISAFARFMEEHFETYQDYGAIGRKPRAKAHT